MSWWQRVKTFERHNNLKCKNTYWQSLKFYEAKIDRIEKRDKQAFLFTDKDIGSSIFIKRTECLKTVKKAQKNYKTIEE